MALDRENSRSALPLMTQIKAFKNKLKHYIPFLDKDYLFKPYDSFTLGVFRIFFGLIMAIEFWEFSEIIPVYGANLKFFFTYDFFHFVRPLPQPWLDWMFYFLIACSLLFAMGLLFRIAAFFQFIGFAYIFLVDKTLYNNHYYLFILLSFLMIFTNAGNVLSLKNLFGRKDTQTSFVPRWNVFIIQAQLFVLYFYGGIAKLNPEWLFYSQPVKTWLPDMLGHSTYDSLSTGTQHFLAFFISYSGLIIDLTAGFLLSYRKTRPYIAVILALFHFSNSQMFNIGWFPWFGIMSMILFFDSSRVRKLVRLDSQTTNIIGSASGIKRKLVKGFLITYLTIQFAFPLRHWLMPGWVMWDERGFMFSWYMKLRTKEPVMAFTLRYPGERDYYLKIDEMLTKKQAKALGYKPFDLVRFAHMLEAFYKNQGEKKDLQVYAEIFTKLHEHNHQLLVNPNVDLTSIELMPLSYFQEQSWIVKFGEDTFKIKRPPGIEYLEASEN